MTSELSLDRLEFHEIKIKTNNKAKSAMEGHIPQLRIEFEKYNLYHRSGILYPDSEIENPRHFAVTYGVKLESKQDELMPYEIEVEAVALLNYQGDDLTGADRFRAVRFSGYQMLHGAVREMVANLTARSRHGLLQIPSRSFNGLAKRESEEDEAERIKRIARLKEKGSPRRGRVDISSGATKEIATKSVATPESTESRPRTAKRKKSSDSANSK